MTVDYQSNRIVEVIVRGPKGERGDGTIPVVDDLNSTATNEALSANQGRILNEKIDAEVASIDADIAQTNANLDVVSSDVTNLDSELTALEADVAAKGNQIDTINSNLSSYDSRITQNESDITTIKSTNTSLTNRMDAAELEIEQNESDIAALDTRLTNAETNITNNDSDIAAVDAKVDSFDARLTTAELNISTNDTDIANLDSRVTSNDTDIAALQAKDTSLDGDIAAVNAKADANASDILALQMKDTSLDGDIAALQAKDTLLDGDIANLESDITSLTSAINAVDAKVISNDTDIAALQAKDTSLDGDIANLDARITSNDNDISNLSSSITSNDTDIANLDVRVTANEIDIAQNTSDVAALELKHDTDKAATDATITTLSGNITTVQSDVTALESKHDTEVAALDARITSNDTELADHEARITSNDADILVVNNKADTNASDIAALEAKDVLIEADVNALDDRLTTAELNISTNDTDISALTDKQVLDDANTNARIDATNLNVSNLSTQVANNDTDIASLQAKDIVLEADITALQNKDTLLDSDIAALDTRVAGNELSIDSITVDIGTINTELADHETRISAIEAETDVVVVDNLTSTSTTDALSANQGKILKDSQDAIDTRLTTAESNITSNDTELADHETRIAAIEALPPAATVIDNLTSTSTTDALSANQGKILKDAQDAIDVRLTAEENKEVIDSTARASAANAQAKADANEIDISDLTNRVTTAETNITSNDADITSLNGRVSSLEAGGGLTVVDNLTSTSTTDALSANQGKVLKDAQDAIDTRLTTAELNISTNDTDIANLQNDVAENTASVTDHETRITNLEEGVGGGGDVNVIDNLISTSSTDALSARQGKVLKDAQDVLDTRLTTAESNITSNDTELADHETRISSLESNPSNIIVEDSLASTSSTNALSANQGKILKDAQDAIDTRVTTAESDLVSIDARVDFLEAKPENHTQVEDILTSTNTDTALSANQGRILKEVQDDQGNTLSEHNIRMVNIESNLGGGSALVIDDLTSTSTTNALSANQGRILDERLTDIETAETGVPIGAMIIASKSDEEKLGLLGYRKADVDKEYSSSVYTELALSYPTEGVLQSLVVDGEMTQSNSSIEIADNIYARTNHNYASTIVAGEVLGDIIIQRGIADNPTDKWTYDASAYFDTVGVYPIGVSKINPSDDYWYLHVAGLLSGTLNIVTLRYNPTITDFSTFVADIVVTSSVIPNNITTSSATFAFCTDNFFLFYTSSTSTKWTMCGLNSDGTSDGNYTDVPFIYTSDLYEEKSILSNNHVFERGEIINLTTGVRTVIKNYDCIEYHATFTRDNKVYLCYRSGGSEFSVYQVNDDSSYNLVYAKPSINLAPIFFGQTGILINPLSNEIIQNPLGVNMIDNSTEFLATDISGWNPNANRMYGSVASLGRSQRKHHFSDSFLLNDINNIGTTEPTQKITAVIDKSMFTVPGIADPNSKQSYYVNTGISTADINPV